MIKEYETDTGFNVICCSCHEYKSTKSCVSLSEEKKKKHFTQEEESKYVIKDETFNKSIDGEYYVCRSCKDQIKSGKKPKRNDQELTQYYDFPNELLNEVKETCSPIERLQNETVLPEELRVSKQLTEECRLNRLENFILKIIIPFIRIANCKMGRYLKVQGQLILISSDIEHSLEKI